jgi:hypothetical protein
MWHIAWTVWAGLGLVMEAVGLARGGPLTRTVRAYLLGGAAGSAAVGAFLTWLAWHWLVVASGMGPGDLIAVAVGAAVGLAGWAYRLGRGDAMLDRIRLATSWAWPIIAEVGHTLLRYGPSAFTAARLEVRALEDVDLSGAEKRDAVVAYVRAQTGLTESELPTYLLHGIVQVALIVVRASR